jgi:hypothetical protein
MGPQNVDRVLQRLGDERRDCVYVAAKVKNSRAE